MTCKLSCVAASGYRGVVHDRSTPPRATWHNSFRTGPLRGNCNTCAEGSTPSLMCGMPRLTAALFRRSTHTMFLLSKKMRRFSHWSMLLLLRLPHPMVRHQSGVSGEGAACSFAQWPSCRDFLDILAMVSHVRQPRSEPQRRKFRWLHDGVNHCTKCFRIRTSPGADLHPTHNSGFRTSVTRGSLSFSASSVGGTRLPGARA